MAAAGHGRHRIRLTGGLTRVCGVSRPPAGRRSPLSPVVPSHGRVPRERSERAEGGASPTPNASGLRNAPPPSRPSGPVHLPLRGRNGAGKHDSNPPGLCSPPEGGVPRERSDRGEEPCSPPSGGSAERAKRTRRGGCVNHPEPVRSGRRTPLRRCRGGSDTSPLGGGTCPELSAPCRSDGEKMLHLPPEGEEQAPRTRPEPARSCAPP